MLQRINVFKNRFYKAASMGVSFLGTQNFKLPQKFKINGKNIYLNAPLEQGLAYDFINVILDDEYGLRKLNSRPNNIIDIGGNIGLFSIYAHYLYPNVLIHTYEPNDRIIKYAHENLSHLGVQLFEEAISNEDGVVTFLDKEESRLGSISKEKHSETSVKLTSLKTAVERIGGTIDLVKIDCEGGEWDIFSDPTPFKFIKKIRMEYHLTNGKSIDEFKKIVTQLGYNIEKLDANRNFGIAWLNKK